MQHGSSYRDGGGGSGKGSKGKGPRPTLGLTSGQRRFECWIDENSGRTYMRALTKTNDWASLLHVQDRPDCGGWEKILRNNHPETWTQDHGSLLPKGPSKGFGNVAPSKNGKGQQGGGDLGYSYGSAASSRFVRSSGVLSNSSTGFKDSKGQDFESYRSTTEVDRNATADAGRRERQGHAGGRERRDNGKQDETDQEDDDSESEEDDYTGYKPRSPSKEEERRRRHQKRDEVVVEKNITTREAKEIQKARPSCGRRDHADGWRDLDRDRRERERKAEKKERKQSRREGERSEKTKRDPERREKKRRDEQQDQTDGRQREARGR
eukprot:g15306.t1